MQDKHLLFWPNHRIKWECGKNLSTYIFHDVTSLCGWFLLVSVIHFLLWIGGVNLPNFVQDIYTKNYKHPWQKKIKWYVYVDKVYTIMNPKIQIV